MKLGAPIAVLGATLVSACLVGPDYERPEVPTPVVYLNAEVEGESLAELQWWQVFRDEELQILIRIAIEENRDLRAAIARVEEARARLGVARSEQFPSLDGAASAKRGNTLGQIFPNANVIDNFFLGAQAAYEADVWGRYRRGTEAQRAELMAIMENQRAVLITLISDVASAYFLLRDLDERIAIAESTVTARRNSTNLIRERFDKGTVAKIDVNQAEIQEAIAMATVASLKRQAVETENLLSVLLGSNPRKIPRGRTNLLQSSPAGIPAGLPAALLERRPDIRSAERQLAAQTARIGVAQSLRFPSIRLTGSLGVASSDLSDLLESDAKNWGIGIDILGPIFDAGRRRSQVEVERARTEQLQNNYEQTVLRAFQEVEDALAGVRYFREELEAREFQVRAAQSAKELSWARYDGGVTDYLEVLEQDRSFFDAQLAASATRRQQLVAIVQLYRALGGGWYPELMEESQASN